MERFEKQEVEKILLTYRYAMPSREEKYETHPEYRGQPVDHDDSLLFFHANAVATSPKPDPIIPSENIAGPAFDLVRTDTVPDSGSLPLPVATCFPSIANVNMVVGNFVGACVGIFVGVDSGEGV